MSMATFQTYLGILTNGGLSCSSATTTSCTSSTASAIAFGLGASTAFVGSLYLVVPLLIRNKPRDDPQHIQWRSIASGLACMGAAAVYQVWFCDLGEEGVVASNRNNDTTTTIADLATHQLRACASVLGHVMLLYLGPLLQAGIEVHVYLQHAPPPASPKKHQQSSINNNNALAYMATFAKTCYAAWVEPLLSDLQQGGSRRWVALRNYVIAPVTEEVLFRGLIVPAFWMSSKSVALVCWTAPLFFGVAHAHHAWQRLFGNNNNRESWQRVLLTSLFQLAYTTLFGAYSSYAYLQTKSLWAVIGSHAFCNWMGLPNVSSFASKRSRLHPYRHVLWAAHVAGLVGFVWEFQSSSSGVFLG